MCMGYKWQGAGSGGAVRAASVRRGLGCPVPNTAGSRQFQSAPRDPLQGTAEPLSQAGGTSGRRRRCSMAERVLTAACGEPTLRQRKSMRKKEWQRETSVFSWQPRHHCPVSLVALLKGLSVTCSDSKKQGEESGVKKWSFT